MDNLTAKMADDIARKAVDLAQPLSNGVSQEDRFVEQAVLDRFIRANPRAAALAMQELIAEPGKFQTTPVTNVHVSTDAITLIATELGQHIVTPMPEDRISTDPPPPLRHNPKARSI